MRSRRLSPSLIEFAPAQIFVESHREFSLVWSAFESCMSVLRSAVAVFITARSIATSNNMASMSSESLLRQPRKIGKTPRKKWSHDEVFRMNISNKHAAAFRLREKFIALESRLAVRCVCLQG